MRLQRRPPAWNSLGDEPVETNGVGTVLGDSAGRVLGGERAGKDQSAFA